MGINPIREAAEQRIFDRIPSIRCAEDGLALLREQTALYGHGLAETVYLKVMTEAGWTPEAAEKLVDTTICGLLDSITETLLAFGATREMAQDLIGVAVDTYGRRLNELATGMADGGAS